eukprot:IDg6525t1
MFAAPRLLASALDDDTASISTRSCVQYATWYFRIALQPKGVRSISCSSMPTFFIPEIVSNRRTCRSSHRTLVQFACTTPSGKRSAPNLTTVLSAVSYAVQSDFLTRTSWYLPASARRLFPTQRLGFEQHRAESPCSCKRMVMVMRYREAHSTLSCYVLLPTRSGSVITYPVYIRSPLIVDCTVRHHQKAHDRFP